MSTVWGDRVRIRIGVEMSDAELKVDSVIPQPGLSPGPRNAARTIAIDTLLVTALMFGLGLIVAIVGAIRLGPQESLRESRAGHVPGGPLATYLAGYAPMVYVSLRRIRRSRVRELFDGPARPAVVWGIAAGVGLWTLGFLHNIAVIKLFGRHAFPDMLGDLRAAKGRPLMLAFVVFGMVVIAPICEELFFRAVLFGSAWSVGQARLGAIASSLLFAIGHLAPYLILLYFASGIVFCLLFGRFKTLLAPIAAHSAVNAISCSLALYSLYFRH